MTGPHEHAAWPEWAGLTRGLLIGTGIAVALSALGALLNAEQFFRSYLFAYLTCLGVSVGCMAILLVQYLTGGTWGLVLRGVLESALAALPVWGLLFIPLLFGLDRLFPWAIPEAVARDPLLQHKRPYLNETAFLARAIVYFVLWCGIAFVFRRGSAAQARAYDPNRARRLQMFAGPALLVYGYSVSFASVDWIMSLEPHWFSTIFGVLIATGWVLPALAFSIVTLTRLARRPPVAPVMSPGLWNDLGTLLLAFVMLWAYMSFSQLLLIWSGNLPEEIEWYLRRIEGGWQVVAWVLFLFYFAFPFFLLLSRDIKQRPERLGTAASALLVIHAIYHLWLTRPALTAGGHGAAEHGEHASHGMGLHWMDPVVLAALAGLWTLVVLRDLRSRALLPENDPDLKEYLAHGGTEHTAHARVTSGQA